MIDQWSVVVVPHLRCYYSQVLRESEQVPPFSCNPVRRQSHVPVMVVLPCNYNPSISIMSFAVNWGCNYCFRRQKYEYAFLGSNFIVSGPKVGVKWWVCSLWLVVCGFRSLVWSGGEDAPCLIHWWRLVQMIGDDGERLRSSDIWTLARHPWPRWLPLHSVTCRQDPMT